MIGYYIAHNDGKREREFLVLPNILVCRGLNGYFQYTWKPSNLKRADALIKKLFSRKKDLSERGWFFMKVDIPEKCIEDFLDSCFEFGDDIYDKANEICRVAMNKIYCNFDDEEF